MPVDELANLEVLVADDDEDVRDLLVEHLRERGLKVATAHSGTAALGALTRASGRFGLVLTDISMPGADGFSVLRAARKARADCSVVIITGYATLDSAVEAMRLGAHDYLTKPFSLGQIDIVLHKMAERRALERENRRLSEHGHANAGVEARLERIEHALSRLESSLARFGPG